MPIYEITLQGFNGGDDKTDHLVKWILTPSIGVLTQFLDKHKMWGIMQGGTSSVDEVMVDEKDIDMALGVKGINNDRKVKQWKLEAEKKPAHFLVPYEAIYGKFKNDSRFIISFKECPSETRLTDTIHRCFLWYCGETEDSEGNIVPDCDSDGLVYFYNDGETGIRRVLDQTKTVPHGIVKWHEENGGITIIDGDNVRAR